EIYSAQWLDNDRLLTTGRDGTARRWSLATGTHDVLPGAPDENRTALWDPAGKAILTYYAYPDPEMPDQQDGTLWDAATSDIIARVPGPVARAIWRPGMLLVSGEAGEARIIDPATGSATL